MSNIKNQNIYTMKVHSELYHDIEMLASEEKLNEVYELIYELIYNDNFLIHEYRESLKILISISRVIKGFLIQKHTDYGQAA